jgi:hypothetical protein
LRTVRTALKVVAVLVAAYALFVLAGVAGCGTDGSGTGDIFRSQTER